MIPRTPSYTTQVHTAAIQQQTVTIENLTPVYTSEEYAEQRSSIEEVLYDIFAKYQEVQE